MDGLRISPSPSPSHSLYIHTYTHTKRTYILWILAFWIWRKLRLDDWTVHLHMNFRIFRIFQSHREITWQISAHILLANYSPIVQSTCSNLTVEIPILPYNRCLFHIVKEKKMLRPKFIAFFFSSLFKLFECKHSLKVNGRSGIVFRFRTLIFGMKLKWLFLACVFFVNEMYTRSLFNELRKIWNSKNSTMISCVYVNNRRFDVHGNDSWSINSLVLFWNSMHQTSRKKLSQIFQE